MVGRVKIILTRRIYIVLLLRHRTSLTDSDSRHESSQAQIRYVRRQSDYGPTDQERHGGQLNGGLPS